MYIHVALFFQEKDTEKDTEKTEAESEVDQLRVEIEEERKKLMNEEKHLANAIYINQQQLEKVRIDRLWYCIHIF